MNQETTPSRNYLTYHTNAQLDHFSGGWEFPEQCDFLQETDLRVKKEGFTFCTFLKPYGHRRIFENVNFLGFETNVKLHSLKISGYPIKVIPRIALLILYCA